MDERDPTDVAALEELQREEREKVERAIKQEGEDISWLMSDKRGRRIVWMLLAQCGIYRLSFLPGATTDTHQVAFSEGKRALGLRIVELIHFNCPHQYGRMKMENTRREQRNADRNTSSD